MKALIVNDTTDWYHFGCTGTSMALKKEIEKLGFNVSSFSIGECGTLNNPPASVQNFFDHVGIERFMATNHNLCNLISENDTIVVNGEGTLHGPKKGPLSLLYIAYIAKNIFFKNVQIINHSVYPHDTVSVENSDLIELYKKVYRSIDFIAIREPLSVSVMKSIGLDVSESFDCLPLYIKQYYRPKNFNKQNDLILLAGSAAWFNLNIFSPGAKPENKLKGGLKQVISALQPKISEGYAIKFLYSDIQHPAKDDEEMMSFLGECMGENFEVIRAPSIDAWLGCVAEAGLLISGRFHHSIAAACLGTKFVALNSNTPKMEGLMTSMGCPKPLLYSDKKLGERLRYAIDKPIFFTNSKNMLECLCGKAQNNFSMLRSLASKL